jgi:hypothetical protein
MGKALPFIQEYVIKSRKDAALKDSKGSPLKAQDSVMSSGSVMV